MDDFFYMLLFAALAIPLTAIAALVVALSQFGAIRRIDARLRALELARAQGSLPRAAAAGPAPAQPAPSVPTATPALPTEVKAAPSAEAAGIPESAPPDLTAAPPPLPSSPPSLPAVSAAPASTPRSISFEERFGTRWVVWVGGVALALGGIFLVRYTIQQGLIGPGVRIALGALLAAALVIAGEWSRRTERRAGIPGLPTADIPSILTAAGTVVAYATVYAAYALYQFLPPGAAFILLGIVALLTLAAALLHGPTLAGLGVVGAFVTPLLVASDQPDYWALYIYIAIVTAAAFALARARMWLWLAVTAVMLGALWNPGVVLPDARSAAFLSRRDSVRADQRRRTILLFVGVASLRHCAPRRRLRAALAAGAFFGTRRDHAHHRQSLHHRYRQHQRHLPRVVGDRARRGAVGDRLSLPASVISARARGRRGREWRISAGVTLVPSNAYMYGNNHTL